MASWGPSGILGRGRRKAVRAGRTSPLPNFILQRPRNLSPVHPIPPAQGMQGGTCGGGGGRCSCSKSEMRDAPIGAGDSSSGGGRYAGGGGGGGRGRSRSATVSSPSRAGGGGGHPARGRVQRVGQGLYWYAEEAPYQPDPGPSLTLHQRLVKDTFMGLTLWYSR